MDELPKPYQVQVGCIDIDDSPMSRDVAMPEGVDSLEDALRVISSYQRAYAERGRKLWDPCIKQWNGTAYERIGRWNGREYRID